MSTDILVLQALITQDYVLVLNAEEDAVMGFVEELQRRLAPKQPLSGRMAGLMGTASLLDLHHVRTPTSFYLSDTWGSENRYSEPPLSGCMAGCMA